MRYSHHLSIFLGAFVILMLVGFLLSDQTSDRETEAQRLIDMCSVSENRSRCYEVEVAALYPERSVYKVFDIIRTIRDLDPQYQFCHVLSHALGERVVAEDPARWVEAIPLNPADGLCSNGFIHGVIGGRFRAEVLDDAMLEKFIPDFSRACEPRENWSPSPLDQAICYHGMGHLFVFITDADIAKGLSLCERTAKGKNPRQDFRRVCREGVFMQIYQPLEPDDFLLIERMEVKPTKETVREYCATFTQDEYVGACLRESWPLFREGVEDGYGIGEFCEGQPNAREETACYESAFSILGRMSLGDSEHIVEACGSVPEERQPMCYEYGAQTTLEEDRASGAKAVALCEQIPSQYQESCLLSLARKVVFNFGSSQSAREFCDLLPEKPRTVCVSTVR
ncbi:hypothetical protein COU18_02420 [Candidatus Kaiserbacteria bacterium CG10_big_fil_rev_8_21_14_0_10_51_14]|uniref:Uncharacterized protein n=1 Tax=Candidatus Kaiserbacteria bacterium CG10_big_fil_rev_8_21_14_0_10_51_14 TaxID=1974610 RepID=A0A2H0UBQ3_9BACT|nr:MAG: hypothetical protein COU18_02420 [Candidatus Kaiserbacteria bacterium CG10_big_fil_rev_8_21_14_0_10_51_14]